MRFAPLYRPIVLLAAICGVALTTDASAGQTATRLWFEDATERSGVTFVHENGRTAERHLPETMGAGVTWLDYDRDGDLDLYLVQSGPLPGYDGAGSERAENRLWQSDGNGGFRVAVSGAENRGYGMGATSADYDDDGWPDLYVTNFGANALYRSNGDGTFSAVPEAGVDDGRWSASAAWGDLDADGWLDLYVTHYVSYDPATAIRCGDGASDETAYCHIDLFDGVADSLYRNRQDGSFDDVASEAGVANAAEGKGLGVVMADIDDDGDTDVYVANDTQQNFLYVSRGDGTFDDEGLFSGTGYSAEGKAQAGMGTDMVDLDGDGSVEILVTNFAFEPNNLYRRFAPGAYLEESFTLGLGEPGLAQLAFGIVAVDFDGDGDRDVAVANGHILDTVESVQDGTRYAQRDHLFENHLTRLRREAAAAPGSDWRVQSGLLDEVSLAAGPALAAVEVSRGLAAGDADGDGRPDLLVTTSGGAARLMANRSPGGHRLVLRLRGRPGNRDALGARVVVTPTNGSTGDGVSGWPQRFDVRSASSYLSQNATELYVGLGAATRADVEVWWPDGRYETFRGVEAGHLVQLEAGSGRPLVRALAGDS